ncbi:hypothetical protein GCK32_022187, partial [Trichostrongylus colubriformis]
MSARETIKRFNAVAAKTDEELKRNPYSDTYNVPHFDKNSSDYGRPPPGSKTEARGIRVSDRVILIETFDIYQRHKSMNVRSTVERLGVIEKLLPDHVRL